MTIEQIAGLTTLAASIAFLMARFFLNRRPKQKKRGEIFTLKGDAIYSRLLTKAQGDHGKATRLIEFERRKQPNASTPELTRAAIERLERDMGR